MKVKSHVIEVSKAINLGTMPVFVQMVHRHFEKENPTAQESWGSSATYGAPVDLLKLTVSDPTLLTDLTSVEFTYAKRT